MAQNLLSAAVMIGALRVNLAREIYMCIEFLYMYIAHLYTLQAGPDLDPNCLQRLSAYTASRQRIKPLLI